MPIHESRILFLKEFTKELIINSKINGEQFAEIKKEEFIETLISPAEKQPSVQTLSVETKPILRIMPINQQIPIKKRLLNPIMPVVKPIVIKPIMQPQVMQEKKLFEVEPLSSSLPSGFSLNKLDFFIQDPRVTIIECPGPKKFLLTRTAGRTEITKLSLNNQEIQSIIEKFANVAKIPIMSGLFKAAVGNLVITAVVSDIAGSRFIITKITPRFIIEQQNQAY